MPGFKIASAYVSVSPDDTGFEDDLRRQISAATDRVNAEVGLRLSKDAPIFLNEDVLAAIDLATEGVRAEVGLGLKGDAPEILAAEVAAGVDLVEEDAKVKVSVDPKSAKDTQQGLSGLVVGGIVGGASIAAPALLAAVDAAFTGITAKALAGNAVIKADYASLAADASSALQQAVAPLAPGLHEAIGQLDSDIGKLQPTLDGLFSNVQPDLTTFATGIDGLVSGALPGLSKALGNSQSIASDVAASMGTLGHGVGDFFTGLTRDASTTGQGLQAVVGTASQALGTLGNVAGSASSAISADLMAITPAADAALTALDKLANPATVGAAGAAFATWKLGGPLEKGLDSVSNKFLDVAAKTENAGGMLGKVSGAAAGASTGFSKMATVMGGPWGIAIGAGIGLLSGLAGELFSTNDATKAVTLSAGDLAKAVAQDGGAAGQATAAYITATSAANGMSDAVGKAGVSQTTWTEAVLGNGQATNTVIESINKLNQAQRNQGITTAQNTADTGKYSDAQRLIAVNAAKAAAANNTLTDANQKVINTLHAEQQQVVDSIAAQTKYQEAMDNVTHTEALFNASLEAAYNQMVANAQAAALNTVGLLNLGNANYGVTSSLDAVVTSYTQAQTEGNAYGQVLQALNGNTQNLLTSEAAFTTALSGVSAAAKANGTSLDANTVKGAANITALSGIATAAAKAADAVYASEVNTKSATAAYNDANTKLAEEKTAFEQAAEKAGYSKTQVDALADAIFKLPPAADVLIKVDTDPAKKGVDDLIKYIDAQTGKVDVYASTSSGMVWSPGSGGSKAHAAGGYAPAGELAIFGEEGPEIGIPRQGYDIIPAKQTAQILSGHAPMPGMRPSITNNFIYNGPQYPGVEQRAQMMHQLATTLGAY